MKIANKSAVKGAVTKSSITMKGLAIIFVIAIVAGFAAIFLNNNVAQVANITKRQDEPWYQAFNPMNWLS